MKRILTTVGLILITLISLNAQNLEFGIKSGLGIANMHITNLSDSESNSDIFSPIISYSINGTLNYKSKGFWGFSIEPGIIKKGWKPNGSTNKMKLIYLQMPLLSDFYLSKKVFLSLGPEINYLVNAKNDTQNNTKYFYRTELSGVIGGTYSISDNLDVGIRYSHGLTQISDIIWKIGESGEFLGIEYKDYNQYLQVFIKLKLKNLR